MHEWLSYDKTPPDVYAIGFQELDLTKEAFLFNDTPREEEWRYKIYKRIFMILELYKNIIEQYLNIIVVCVYRQVVAKSLHPDAVYEQVAIVRLVGMMLLIYALHRHIPYIKDVSVDTVGTGIMGKMVIYLSYLVNN